ncbi:hypothetical protein BsWGS_08217 [Bradybaena similaris]
MDIQSKDILEQLLKRLDKIENQQHKLDRVMERLDTLQNILERQNQKQNLLDELLVKMAIKPEQDKVVTTEQLHGAQQESVQSFCVIDRKEDSTQFPHRATQPFQGRANQTDDTLKSIDNRTVDTAQKCCQLISWSQKFEGKLTDNNMENMKTILAEIRSVKDLVRGQTNAELIWLNNQIDKKLTVIDSVVREIYQQQTGAKEEIVRSAGQVVKTVIHHDKQGSATESLGDKRKSSTEIFDKLDLERRIPQLNSSVCDLPREMKTSLDTISATKKQFVTDFESIKRKLKAEMNEKSKEQSLSVNESVKSALNKLREAVQSEIETNNMFISESDLQGCRKISTDKSAVEDVKHLIQAEEGGTSKYKELENIHTLIKYCKGYFQGKMATVVKEVESTKASMMDGHATVNKHLNDHTADLKSYIDETNYVMFAVIDKEVQVSRDLVQGTLLPQGKHTFGFYVPNFKTFVRSDNKVLSLTVHISEMQIYVTGRIRKLKNGEIQVWLLCGRLPREVGLQPRSSKSLEIKATVCDIHEKELPHVCVAEAIESIDEMSVEGNYDWGHQVGVISCDELLQKGNGEKEGCVNGDLLIRYVIDVL